MSVHSTLPIDLGRVTTLIVALQLLVCGTGCGGFWTGGSSSGTTAHIVSLAITPNPYQVALGNSGQLKATGTFSDGKDRDLTSSVGWAVDGGSVASVSTT